jgi:hypothetical protein
MLPKVDNLLLHLAPLTVGAYSLVVGAVLFTVPLYVDRSYVDGSLCVVFIIDTTYSTISCQGQLIGEKGISVLGCIVSRDT